MKGRKSNMASKLVILISFILMVCVSTAAADARQNSGDLEIIKGPQIVEDIMPLGDTQWLVKKTLKTQIIFWFFYISIQ